MIVTTLLLAVVVSAGANQAAEPILLDFHAPWCGPCKEMRPVVRQLIAKKYPVRSVDVDRSPELAGRYKVTGVPAFIVVDPEGKVLARTEGPQPASQLVRMYLDARRQFEETRDAVVPVDLVGQADPVLTSDADEPPAADDEGTPGATFAPNPDPWQTVVRIKVQGAGGMTGFGSGTIIYSDPGQAIILTCAHIFKVEGRQQYPPSKFPRRIMVDLFDGKLVGKQPGKVRYEGESYQGQAMDYDFDKDVGLIRIRPGKTLPAARVVPKFWVPKKNMAMTAVGCPEGQDATAWTTMIVNANMRAPISGHAQYEAIECTTAPKQGRSGGGLFTSDGFVAGVCDFADPNSDRGLYATPRSIYQLLDRNNLMALYAPPETGPKTMLAGNTKPRPRAAQGEMIARAQSPDPDSISVPSPDLLGIQPIDEAQDWTSERRSSRSLAGGATTVPAKMRRPAAADEEMLTSDDTAAEDSRLNAEDIPVNTPPKASGTSGWTKGQYRDPARQRLLLNN